MFFVLKSTYEEALDMASCLSLANDELFEIIADKNSEVSLLKDNLKLKDDLIAGKDTTIQLLQGVIDGYGEINKALKNIKEYIEEQLATSTNEEVRGQLKLLLNKVNNELN